MLILQETARKRPLTLSQKNGFSIGRKRQKGSVFPYMPATGYKWSGKA